MKSSLIERDKTEIRSTRIVIFVHGCVKSLNTYRYELLNRNVFHYLCMNYCEAFEKVCFLFVRIDVGDVIHPFFSSLLNKKKTLK